MQATQHEKIDQDQKIERLLGCLWRLSKIDERSVRGLYSVKLRSPETGKSSRIHTLITRYFQNESYSEVQA